MANLQICLDDIQLYVGTYRKYNEGSLFGKWVKLSDYPDFDGLSSAMRELHSDEEDPELMFQDYEAPELLLQMSLISECYISKDIYSVIDSVKNSPYSAEILSAYIDCFGYCCSNIDELIDKVDDSYAGEYSSDEEFAEELLTDTGSIPDNLPNYIHIDWESTAREIMFDYSASNGNYFRNL